MLVKKFLGCFYIVKGFHYLPLFVGNAIGFFRPNKSFQGSQESRFSAACQIEFVFERQARFRHELHYCFGMVRGRDNEIPYLNSSSSDFLNISHFSVSQSWNTLIS